MRGNALDVAIDCSKGTYIRVLAEELGERLGCGATLGALRRTRVGGFRLEGGFSLQALEEMAIDARRRALLPVDAALAHLPSAVLSEEETRRIRSGQRIEAGQSHSEPGPVRIYREASRQFLGLAAAEDGWLRPQRLLASADPA